MDENGIARIRGQLEGHDVAAAVLFCTIHPCSSGSAWMDPIGLEGRELLQELIREDARIRLVCCGHRPP